MGQRLWVEMLEMKGGKRRTEGREVNRKEGEKEEKGKDRSAERARDRGRKSESMAKRNEAEIREQLACSWITVGMDRPSRRHCLRERG